MSQRIRLGNTYNHDSAGLVLTVHRDNDNTIWFRTVTADDNAGVISTGEEIHREPYRDFLGNVSMRDYPENWDGKARAVKERDEFTCQGCGARGEHVELHAHHIVPLGAGGSNARSNLITLCDECHGRIHGGPT